MGEGYKIVKHTEKNGTIKTIAIMYYAGKIFRGVSKCRPDDTYSEYFGELLAMLRCSEKIAKFKEKRIFKLYYDAVVATEQAEKREAKLLRKYNKMVAALNEETLDREALENFLNNKENDLSDQ